MATFVFIEITDRDLNWLFSSINRILDPDKPWRSTHLTIRGPYSGKLPKGLLAMCRKRLGQDVLRIGDVGSFSNPDEHVVYLKVDSPNLRSVWWKPDFPIKEHGFNPHISLYRGKDAGLAAALTSFFHHEAIELLCAEFRVVRYVSRQAEMELPDTPMRIFPFHERISGNVKENLLGRLDLVVKRHRRRQSNTPNQANRADG